MIISQGTEDQKTPDWVTDVVPVRARDRDGSDAGYMEHWLLDDAGVESVNITKTDGESEWRVASAVEVAEWMPLQEVKKQALLILQAVHIAEQLNRISEGGGSE